ncbi:hypothetical protein I352_04515 [Cryptococcus deuterogattii MMRL2647]|nr:hypothetical protein I352_04515 [Cryptococcus deuterogattii MMRL2647]
MRDYGHIVVQDHMLDKHNRETRPDFCDKYCYGDSIPVPKNELKQTLKAKLQDIWRKGGKGPICMAFVHVSRIPLKARNMIFLM